MEQIFTKMKSYGYTDVLHYDIYATILTKEKTAHFTATVLFKVTQDNLAKIVFHLGTAFTLESVTMGNVPLRFGMAMTPSIHKILRIFPDSPLKKDKEYTLTFTYSLKKDEGESIFPYIKDSVAYFGGFASWYPVVHLEDAYSQNIAVTVLNQQTVYAFGTLEKSETKGNLKTYYFKTENPILMGSVIEVAPFKTYKEKYKNIDITIYCDEDNEEFYKEKIKDIKFIVDFYSERFGGYPYKHFTLVLDPYLEGMGGLFYGVALPKNKITFDDYFHEAAHIWWGFTVYIKFWIPFGVLGEGLAHYSALLALQNKFGDNEILKYENSLKDILKTKEVAILQVKSGAREMLIFRYKGALMFRMLNWIVGDDVFFKILKTYLKRYKHQWPEIKDFQSVADEVYGEKLDWFFDPWLNTTQKLDLTIENVNVTQEKKKYVYTFALKNIGDMNMPVDVEIKLKGSKKEEIKKVPFSGSVQEITLNTTFPATELLIDPHYWLFDFNRANNTVKLTQ